MWCGSLIFAFKNLLACTCPLNIVFIASVYGLLMYGLRPAFSTSVGEEKSDEENG